MHGRHARIDRAVVGDGKRRRDDEKPRRIGHAVAGDDLADLIAERRSVALAELRGRVFVDIGRKVDYGLRPERQRAQRERREKG